MSLQCKLVTVWLVLFHLTLWRRTSARNTSLINSRVRGLRLCHDTIYQIVSPLYTLWATTTLPLLFRLKILWSLHKTFHPPSSGGGEGKWIENGPWGGEGIIIAWLRRFNSSPVSFETNPFCSFIHCFWHIQLAFIISCSSWKKITIKVQFANQIID